MKTNRLIFDLRRNLYRSEFDVGAAGSIVPALDVSPIGPLTVLSATPVFQVLTVSVP